MFACTLGTGQPSISGRSQRPLESLATQKSDNSVNPKSEGPVYTYYSPHVLFLPARNSMLVTEGNQMVYVESRSEISDVAIWWICEGEFWHYVRKCSTASCIPASSPTTPPGCHSRKVNGGCLEGGSMRCPTTGVLVCMFVAWNVNVWVLVCLCFLCWMMYIMPFG